MKFSIIIPVYNVENYIAACIDSVLGQSHQNWEIILVDDGSTDSSGKICDQLAERYPDKITAIHNPNKGPYIARMEGLKHISGDAVLFVDADDAIRADALEQIGTGFERTACDMVCFNASRAADFSAAFCSFPFEDGKCYWGESKKELYGEVILNSSMNSLCMKAFKRDLLMNLPQHCKEFSGHNAEDLWLVLPLITAAGKALFINQNLYYYRSRPSSIVHSYNPARHRTIKCVHDEMEKYIDKWDMGEYHAMHYAREVRGWIECLKLMLVNSEKPDICLIEELAQDKYFLKAYAGMKRGELLRRDVLLGKWLYGGKYRRILMAGSLMRSLKAFKRFLKGNKKHGG